MAVMTLFSAMQSSTELLRWGVTRMPLITGWSMPTVKILCLFINVCANSTGE